MSNACVANAIRPGDDGLPNEGGEWLIFHEHFSPFVANS